MRTSDVSSRKCLRLANCHQLVVPDTTEARLVVGLSPLQLRWNGTRFHTHSGTLLGVPTVSDRL